MLCYNYISIISSLFVYLFIYNITIMVLFNLLIGSSFNNIKTNNIFFFLSNNKFKFNLILISLLSIAGIPPFLGFFLKIKIINIIGFISFFKFFFFLMPFMFLSLFFYMQNVRYLFINKYKNIKISFLGDFKNNILSNYIFIIILFFISLGLFFIDDLFLVFSWIVIF